MGWAAAWGADLSFQDAAMRREGDMVGVAGPAMRKEIKSGSDNKNVRAVMRQGGGVWLGWLDLPCRNQSKSKNSNNGIRGGFETRRGILLGWLDLLWA